MPPMGLVEEHDIVEQKIEPIIKFLNQQKQLTENEKKIQRMRRKY